MPLLFIEKDLSGELDELPGSVSCVLEEAARLKLIPATTRLFMIPGLDPTIEDMTNCLHGYTVQEMAMCAKGGIPEQGMLVMRNSCIVGFGKACEAATLVFNGNFGLFKVDIMLDPRRFAIPDLMDVLFAPKLTPEIQKFLANFWSMFDGDTTLDEEDLRQIGANSAYGACLFFAHRNYMSRSQENIFLNETSVQTEMRSTLEYVIRVGISFYMQHILRVINDPNRTIKIDLKRVACS